MNIIYKLDVIPEPEVVIELFTNANLKRPNEPERIASMLKNADLLVTAWQEDKLVGISRTITDWVWCAYLADLAVFTDLKSSGIGKEMVAITRENLVLNACSSSYQYLLLLIITLKWVLIKKIALLVSNEQNNTEI